MSVSLHRLIRASMGSFPAAFVAPSRNREYPYTFLHSAEVVTYTHKRSKPCCTSEQLASSTLPWCGAQSMIQANHCSSPRPRRPTLLYIHLHLYHICRPFWCTGPHLYTMDSTIGRLFLTPPCPHLYTMGRPLWVTLTIHHRPPYRGTFRGSTSPIAPPADNSYDMACPFWTQYRGIFTGIPPSCCPRQDVNSYGKAHPLICERKKIHLTSPSHTRSYG
jgi:hypothetical protein